MKMFINLLQISHTALHLGDLYGLWRERQKNQAKHVTSSQNIPSRPHHNRLMMQKLLSTITATPSFTFTRPYRQATSKQHHNVSNPCPLPSPILCPVLHPCLPASSPPRQPPANSRRDPPGPPALVLLPIAWLCLVFGLFGAGCMDTLTSQPQLWHASALEKHRCCPVL
jgi:hypothetical protein